jgi:hypothetical protein
VTKRPADGERFARIGYEAQDKRAADLIYNVLVEGRLDWFRIADPDAGRVDDIQVATTDGQLHAFQVKWADSVQNISFADFTRSGKEPSLVSQLADGWRTLKAQYPDKCVFVHLVHRNIPLPTLAPKAQIPLGTPPPIQPHFQALIRECWKDKQCWISAGLNGIPQGWHPAMEVVRKEAGFLNEKEFLDFIAACDLHFGYQFPDADDSLSRTAVRREKDVDQIARLISKLGGGEKRVIEISRADLLKELGWEARFEFRFKHEFVVDQSIYQPITQTVQDLETAISQFSSGYLALIGTPGSGKSTTLTQTLRYRQGLRIIRYYAYVPDSIGQEGRGEALSFLHDLHLALQRQGIFAREGKQSQPETLDELRDAIRGQLVVLQDRWHEERLKTLIIIDGLDHIAREQSPVRSLLNELPLPENIPDGVLLILGSQTLKLDDFNSRINHQLQEVGRTLVMQPLSRQAVSGIITAYRLPISLSQEQLHLVHALANGHPLALGYLLAKLRHASDEATIDAVLASTQPYDTHIEDSYRVYWDKLQRHENLKELLAMLSRLRGPFNPEDWLEWEGEPVIKTLLEYARHYFREESDTRWHFFHNSFRQFILVQSRVNVLGKQDSSRDRAYHKRIAEYAAYSAPETPWSWEEIYHRSRANDWEKVLQLGTQDYFRRQFFRLRPLEAILEDIDICLEAARLKRDGLAIIRMVLIDKELRDRHENIDMAKVDMPALLFELLGMSVAMRYVMDGQQLRIGEKEALDFVALLLEKGESKAAESVFNAAEPLDVLSGTTAVERTLGGNQDTLYAWVQVAHYFRPLDQAITVIGQLRADTSHFVDKKQNLDSWHRSLRRDVMEALTSSIYDSENDGKLCKLTELLRQHEDGKYLLRRLDFWTCSDKRDLKRASEALDRLLSNSKNYEPFTKLRLAEFLYHIRNDKEAAAKLLSEVPQPQLQDISLSGTDSQNLTAFSHRIRLNRMLAMMGQQKKPVDAVPDDNEARRRGGVLFERCLVIIANIWGQAWAGNTLPPSTILRELHPALCLFAKNWRETQDWGWYAYKRTTDDFYAFVIHAVAAHGQEALVALSQEFDHLWQKQPHYWEPSLRRTIALELYEKGGCSAETLVQRLAAIEELYGVSDDVSSLASEYSKHAFAWLKAGQSSRAMALLPRLFENSFGIVYEKDYQFSNWIGLLAKTTATLPGFTAEDIPRFASALLVLEDTGRCRGTRDAAVDLMTLVAQWHPAYALQLKDWLLTNHSIYYTNALEGILSAAASSPDAPIELVFILTCHLLIPFAGSVPADLPKLLSQQATVKTSPSTADALLHILEKTVETKAFPSDRAEWWRGLIDGLQATGVDSSYFQNKLKRDTRENKYESDLTVFLKSGEKLTNRDALLRITTGQDLLNFIEGCEEVKYFRWYDAIAKIIDSLELTQIRALHKALERFEPRSTVNVLFAKRLKALGCVDEGRAMLQPLLDQSVPHGWSRRYDGGTRLTAVQALIDFDADEGREKAFDLLIKDYLASWRYPSTFLLELEEFLPLLFVKMPIDEVWREIREHVYQLHEFSDTKTLPPLIGENNKSWQTVLLQLISELIPIEITEVREECHRALCAICLSPAYDTESSSLLKILLNGTETDVFHALAVLESVLEQRPQYVGTLAPQIINLCISPNIVIRTTAARLAQDLDISYELPGYKQLPMIYSLELPEFPNKDEVIPFNSLPPGASYPDCDDPLEMTRPFGDEFELLAEMSDVPFENLIHRAAILMTTLSPKEQWNMKAEENMKSWLKAADLEFTYHRLRPQQALRALHHVTAELADAEKLDSKALAFIQRSMRRHDKRMSCNEPQSRPLEILVPERDEMGLDRDKDWLNKGAGSFPAMPDRIHSDGRVVLAELTRIRHLSWETPTECRFGMLCHPDWPTPDTLHDASNFFLHNHQWIAEDYPRLNIENIPTIVLYGHPRAVELGGHEWLAFNPKIALHFGWKPCTSGLFRWKDQSGVTTVESIWWQDGALDRQPPWSDTCSEGWRVVATESAFEEIKKLAVPSVRSKAVIRLDRKKGKRAVVCRSHI